MTWELLLATLALLVSALAALYARWSFAEAKKANDIGHLNALIALRTYYLSMIQHQADLVKTLDNLPSVLQSIQHAHAELDTN